MSAPGSICVTCARKTRPSRPTGDVDAQATAHARSPEEVSARDRAILDRLKIGPASFEQLAAALPGDFDHQSQRDSACRSAILRMKAKSQLKIVPEGYAAA